MPTGVYIRTEAYRAKQRATHLKMGTKPPCLSKEVLSANAKRLGLRPPSRTGIKHTDDTRAKMRASAQRGSKNVNWKGGVSDPNRIMRKSTDFKRWREKIFKRDDYTCQKYGTRGVPLHPHHILNFAEYPKLRFKISNGITLSKKAHDEFHHRYGKKHNTREQLMEFLGSGQ